MSGVTIFPTTPERWDGVETVFRDCSDGRKCWCAFWYLPNKDFKAGWVEGNAAHLKSLVLSGSEPGVLAYVDGVPAGWLSVAPRQNFDRLNRSKSFAPVDDKPVWAMNCFIVRKAYRKSGLMRALIAGGIDFVRDKGGKTIEAYPFESNRAGIPGYDLFVGTAAAFRDHSFVEVARHLPTRPIMRLEI